MDTMLFKNTIKDFFLKCYDVIYEPKLSLEEFPDSDMFIYKIKIDLNNHDKPLVISAQLESEDLFLDYVMCELIKRRLSLTSYFKLENIQEMVKRANSGCPEVYVPNITPAKQVYPLIYGSSDNILTNEEIYSDLVKDQDMKSSKYNISAYKQYIYICYPESLGRLESITQNTFNVINAFTVTVGLINNISYFIYRTIDKTTSENEEFILKWK